MTLWVHAYCGYPSYANSGTKWAQDDWDAWTVVHAAKGHDLKQSFARIKALSGAKVLVNNSNKGTARSLFGAWAAARITELALNGGHLIAVPSSDCLAFDTDKKGMSLAQAVAMRSHGYTAESALHWEKKMEKASEGGPRDIATLHSNLIIWTDLPLGNVILVDDVVTSGGHVRACARLLREYGHTVEHVLTVARTVHEHPKKGMFALPAIDLEAELDWDF